MQITILSVSTETIPSGKGSYQRLEIAYKDEQGQVKGKKVMSFGGAVKAFKVLKDAKQGEVYSITAEKNKDDYWDWVEAVKVEGTSKAPSVPAGKVLGSNYETAEERARKQVYIIRQSSLASAIAYYANVTEEAASEDSVIDLAKKFEAYVLDIPQAAVETFPNDIPD